MISLKDVAVNYWKILFLDQLLTLITSENIDLLNLELRELIELANPRLTSFLGEN